MDGPRDAHPLPPRRPSPPSLGVSLPSRVAARAARVASTSRLYGVRESLGDSAPSDAQLHVMEFGTLTNAAGEDSPEPGAFGAAWVAGIWALSLLHGIDELYHWSMLDVVSTSGDGDRALLYGWA